VILPPFDLHRARTVDEAHELLVRYGDDAAVICGGSELLLLMKLGYARYGHLVDIRGIAELGGIRAEDSTLVIGATTTHREIERSALVLEQLPALAAMERRVANIRVRSVGTLAGNLCFSDPHSDPATFLLALDAEAEWDGGSALLAEFLVGPYQTRLEPGELLRAVHVPLPAAGTHVVHRKLAFRERPAVTVTVALRAQEGAVAEARIAVGSVGARAMRASSAEARLGGASIADTVALGEAAELAARAAEAVDDANGSAEYKTQLVRVLVERCIREATESTEQSSARS
jgi:aerobic carbon-monoxide dehydrogenase medium subunit